MAKLRLGKILDHPFIKGYGFPAGAALVAIIILLLSVRPVVGKIMQLRREQVSSQEMLSVLTVKVQKLEDFEANPEVLDEEFTRFDQAIPSEIGVPTLLTQIQTVANTAGVKVTVLQFGGVGGGARETEEGEAGPEQLNEVRLKLSVEGSFDNIVKLLQTLETATRLIDAESVGYNIQEAEMGTPTLTAELTLISYYISTPSLVPENPITFSFADEAFQRNSEVLQRMTPYKTEIP